MCIAAALVLGLVAGCGGGTNTQTSSTRFGPFGKRLPPVKPAAEWAEGLCSAMITYTYSLSSAADHLTRGMLSTQPGRTASEVESATKAFTRDVNDLGMPDTKPGEQAKDAVDELADYLESSADQMEIDVIESGLFDDPTESVRTTLKLMVAEV